MVGILRNFQILCPTYSCRRLTAAKPGFLGYGGGLGGLKVAVYAVLKGSSRRMSGDQQDVLVSQRKLPPRSHTMPTMRRSRSGSPDVKPRTDESPRRPTNGFVVESEVLKRDPVEPVSRRVGDWLLKSDASIMEDLEEEINAWVVPPSPTGSQRSREPSSAFLSHEFQGSFRSHPLAGSSVPSRKDVMKFDSKWEPELRSKCLGLANAKVSCLTLCMRPLRWPAQENMRARIPERIHASHRWFPDFSLTFLVTCAAGVLPVHVVCFAHRPRGSFG